MLVLPLCETNPENYEKIAHNDFSVSFLGLAIKIRRLRELPIFAFSTVPARATCKFRQRCFVVLFYVWRHLIAKRNLFARSSVCL